MNLQFWFEYGSTYSYPAAMRIEALAARHRVEIDWRVFLLGPLFKSQQGMSDSPFNVVPVKGLYMWRDLTRVCDKYGLELNRPAIFPQNSLLAARVTLGLDSAQRPAFAKQVYRANFVEGQDISSTETLSACLKACDADPADALAAAEADKLKTELRSQTEQAIGLGLFGAPSFVCPDGEVFWGHDRLEDALDWTVRGTLRPPQ